MKKMFVLALAMMMVMMVAGAAMADEIPAGSVSFPVTWTVEPIIYFSVNFGDNYASFANGELTYGNPEFSPYVFESRIANYGQAWFGTEEIMGDRIYAIVDSNDWWQLDFVKPRLNSDNDHQTSVPVYAKRTLFDYYTGQTTETDWFAGNDKIKKDLGVHDIYWDMKVEFENWNTRYGNYENVYTMTVFQF